MKDFQFWLTFGTATIPALLTGLLSFIASWRKNRSDIKSLREKFKHDMESIEKKHHNDLEKLEKQYQHDFKTMERAHFRELETMKEAHKLELENIQKQSELDMTKDIFGTIMNAAMPALQEVIGDEVKKQRVKK